MADTKTSDETAATALDGTELTRIVQSGSSKKTTLAVAGHQFRGARVRMTSDDTAQNVTGSADISFDAAVFDTDSFWSAGSPTRLTIPAGKGFKYVVVTGQVNVSSTTADTWTAVAIRQFDSGGTVKNHVGQRNVEKGTTGIVLAVSTGPLLVADGDYFTLLVHEESDNSVTIEGDAAPINTFLALHVVGMEPV